MGKVRSSYISGQITTRKLLILAAAGRPTPDDTRTTKAISTQTGVSEDGCLLALGRFEKDGLVERKRGPHNRAIWMCTKNGFAALLEVMPQKFRIPEAKSESVALDPRPLLKAARQIRKDLKTKFGWREWQVRRRLRTCTITRIRWAMKVSARKEGNSGGYAWRTTESNREKLKRKERAAAGTW